MEKEFTFWCRVIVPVQAESLQEAQDLASSALDCLSNYSDYVEDGDIVVAGDMELQEVKEL